MVKRTRKRNSSRRRNSTRKYSRRRNSVRKYSRKRNNYRNNTRSRNTRRRNIRRTRHRNTRRTKKRMMGGGKLSYIGWIESKRFDSPLWANSKEHENKCQICDKSFGNMLSKKLTLSQHHCRRCGIAVCDSCSKGRMILDKWLEDKKPHAVKKTESTEKLRVCDWCRPLQLQQLKGKIKDRTATLSLLRSMGEKNTQDLENEIGKLEQRLKAMLAESGQVAAAGFKEPEPALSPAAQPAAASQIGAFQDFDLEPEPEPAAAALAAPAAQPEPAPEGMIKIKYEDLNRKIHYKEVDDGYYTLNVLKDELAHESGDVGYKQATATIKIGDHSYPIGDGDSLPKDPALIVFHKGDPGGGLVGTSATQVAPPAAQTALSPELDLRGSYTIPQLQARIEEKEATLETLQELGESTEVIQIEIAEAKQQLEELTAAAGFQIGAVSEEQYVAKINEMRAKQSLKEKLMTMGFSLPDIEIVLNTHSYSSEEQYVDAIMKRIAEKEQVPLGQELEPEPQPQVALPQRAVAAASLEPQGVTHSSIIYGDPISTLHQLRNAVPGTLVLFDIDDTLIRREKSWVRKWNDTLQKHVDEYEPQVRSLDENLPPLLEQLTRSNVSILALTARYHNEHLKTKEELGSEISRILVQSSKFSDLVWSDGEDKKYEEGIIYCTDRQVAGVDPKVHAFKQLQDYFLRKGIINIIYVDDLKDHIDHMSAYFKTLPINTLVVQYTLGSQISFLSDMNLTDQEDKPEQYLIDEALTRLKGGETLLEVGTEILQKSDAIKTLLNHGFTREFATANVNAIREMIIEEAIANPHVNSYEFWTDSNIVKKARNIQ